MAISASLIAKGITGTLALAAPVATSVYYKDSIYELFVPKETNQIDPQRSGAEESKPEDGTWTIQEETTDPKKIKIIYPNNKECSLTVTVGESVNLSSVKEKLESFIGNNSLTENTKRHRRGLIKKCGTEGTSLPTLNVNDSSSIDLSSLFDLNGEELNEEEKKLASKTWTPDVASDTSKLTVTITITVDNNEIDESKISVKTCKIIGKKDSNDSESIDAANLKSSEEDIKQSIKTETDKTDNTEGKKKFLKKCKNDFSNEIALTLKKKTDGSNKYELLNISSEFQ